MTPVDHGDLCLNYDKAWFASKGVPAPTSMDDLTDKAYEGELVTENPATSTPGLAFMLATIAKYGPDNWQGYWQKLRANEVSVVDGWEAAYSTSFSGSSCTIPSRSVPASAPRPRKRSRRDAVRLR